MQSIMRILVSSWLLLTSLVAVGETPPPTSPGAPILLYHHVANDTPASTSISPAQFEQHMAYINEHHTVLPLTEIVAAIKAGKSLPANALAITFDDGYKNILTNGHPILRRYDFPYTILATIFSVLIILFRIKPYCYLHLLMFFLLNPNIFTEILYLF